MFYSVNSKTRNKKSQAFKVHLFYAFCVVLSDLTGFLRTADFSLVAKVRSNLFCRANFGAKLKPGRFPYVE